MITVASPYSCDLHAERLQSARGNFNGHSFFFKWYRPIQEATGLLCETPAGKRPVREWVKSLPAEDRQIVGRDVQKVEFGWPIGMPYCRSLGNGLWEVRSDLTSGKIGRVIFCVLDGKMVLLHGFIKKTQKTPDQDVKLALKRMKDVGTESA